MYDDTKPEPVPAGLVPEMPLHNDNVPSKLQIFVSNTFFDSLFKAVIDMKSLIFWARSTDQESDFPIELNTTTLNEIFPGMKKLYGPGLPVDIRLKVIQAERFDSAKDNSTVHAVVGGQCTFFVMFPDGSSSQAADLMITETKAGLQFIIEALTITPQMQNLNIGKLSVITSTVGDIDLEIVRQFMNFFFSTRISIVNELLKEA